MIPRQQFGSTGHQSTRTIFGAAALGRATDEEAAPVLDLILQHGLNHIDTAAMYGRSERRVGTWMDRHRKDFFLATKTGERTMRRHETNSTTRLSDCVSTTSTCSSFTTSLSRMSGK